MNWDDIKSDWSIVDNFVKSKRPQLSVDDVKKEIQAQFDTLDDKNTVLPKNVSNKIQEIIKQSTAWSDIKTTGKSYFSGNVYIAFERIVEKCEESGILILEIGELEGFYKPYANLHGPAWVNEVLQLDFLNDSILVEAKTFVKKLLA
jgi:hypothetical protein